MAGAQFIGKEKLLTAFERRGGGTWQLAQGKKVCATGNGAQELEEWVDIFAVAESRSPYTLHMYGDMEPEEITKSTQPEASWDFMMQETRAGVGTVSGTAGVVSKLQQKIDDRIADKLGKYLDDDDEPEETGQIDLIAIINDYAQNPHKLGQVIGAVNSLGPMLRNLFGMNSAQPGAAIGSLSNHGQKPQPVQQPTADAGYPDGTYERLVAVLDILGKRDPKLIDHLEKLAALDETTFSIIMAKVDAL